MSRSRRKNPVSSITKADSEKEDKRRANRRLRARERQALDKVIQGVVDFVFTELVWPRLREASNVYKFAKDGKTWWGPIPVHGQGQWSLLFESQKEINDMYRRALKK